MKCCWLGGGEGGQSVTLGNKDKVIEVLSREGRGLRYVIYEQPVLKMLMFSKEMSPFMITIGSCALLGNQVRPTLEMQFFVTIVESVLSLFETWLIAEF